jgi:hypothetical protein
VQPESITHRVKHLPDRYFGRSVFPSNPGH